MILDECHSEQLMNVTEGKDVLLFCRVSSGKEHFKAIGEDIGFTVANKFDVFMGSVL